MAQKTQLIFSDNPGSLPASYAVAPSLDLVVQSIVAKFNGASAAGPFLPCLAVYSQDGHLVGRFHPNTTLEVGDTATVTYAPFLKSGASAGATTAHYYAMIRGDSQTMLDNTVTQLRVDATSHSGLGTAFDEDVNHMVEINADFLFFYTIELRVQWPAFAGKRYIEITTANPSADIPFRAAPARTGGSAAPEDTTQTVCANFVGLAQGGFVPVLMNAWQNSGVSQNIDEWGATFAAHAITPVAA